MSTESEVITGTIEIKDAAVTQTGFGVPMIAVHHTFWPERVRTFEDAGTLLLPPYSVPPTHKAYLMARALKAQKPCPPEFKIGKRRGGEPQVLQIRLSSLAEGEVFTLRIDGTLVTYTAASAIVADELAALSASIEGTPGLGALDLAVDAIASTITLSANAGVTHQIEPVTTNFVITDVTPAATGPTIAVDLAEIRAADDDWYGLLIDTHAQADILAAAAWAETQRILLLATIGDTDAIRAAGFGEGPEPETDTASKLRDFGYHRTIPMWHHLPASQQAACAWAGRILPKAPGSMNWANNSLAGVEVSKLDATARGLLHSRNCNFYTAIKGIGFTLDGKASSGRFADITHGMDWFEVRVQERIVGVFANSDKIGFTDKHVDLFRAQVIAQILEGITAQVIDGDAPWTVTVPLVATVSPNDRIARTMPNLRFTFVLQGAVNKVRYNGTVLLAAPLAA